MKDKLQPQNNVILQLKMTDLRFASITTVILDFGSHLFCRKGNHTLLFGASHRNQLFSNASYATKV